MTDSRIRRAGVAGALVAACAAAMLAQAGPAAAVPPAGPGESVIFTYYDSEVRTYEVGGWAYGTCVEPYQWGRKTSHFTYRKVTCR